MKLAQMKLLNAADMQTQHIRGSGVCLFKMVTNQSSNDNIYM